MIQVELNGKLTEVSKHQLFALAKRGEIGPETRIVVDGKESKARKVKGLEFGEKSVSKPPTDQDRLAQYRQKHYGQVQPIAETKEEKSVLPIPPVIEQEIKASGSKAHKTKTIIIVAVAAALFLVCSISGYFSYANGKRNAMIVTSAKKYLETTLKNPKDAEYVGKPILKMVRVIGHGEYKNGREYTVSGDVKVMNDMGAKLTKDYCVRVVLDKNQKVIPYLVNLDNHLLQFEEKVVPHVTDSSVPMSGWRDLTYDEKLCFAIVIAQITLEEFPDVSGEFFQPITSIRDDMKLLLSGIEDRFFDPQDNTPIFDAVRVYWKNEEERIRIAAEEEKNAKEKEKARIKQEVKDKFSKFNEEIVAVIDEINPIYQRYVTELKAYQDNVDRIIAILKEVKQDLFQREVRVSHYLEVQKTAGEVLVKTRETLKREFLDDLTKKYKELVDNCTFKTYAANCSSFFSRVIIFCGVDTKSRAS